MKSDSCKWDFSNPFLLDRLVTDQDVDELLHTNNTVYVNWCQEVAWAHSENLGLNIERYRELDRAMAVVHSEYQFLRPSRGGDAVKIATWIVSWDRKLRMSRNFQIVRISDGLTLMRGKMLFACIEISTGKPKRLPKEFVAGYGPAVIT